MRKFIYICSLIINPIYVSLSLCQNIINPYKDHLGVPSSYPVLNAPPGNNLYSLHPNDISNLIQGWAGEYEISLRDHFWHQDLSIRSDFAKSVIVEAVSFPFLPPCGVSANGCEDASMPPIQRKLMLPWGNYDQSTYSWLGGLQNRTVPIPFKLTTTNGQTDDHMTLVSAGFTSAMPIVPPSLGNRYILPHSVLKHTVRLHCGPDINYDVISSFTFYYDLTRGRTRWYPFTPDNLDSSPEEHDLMFRPILHIRPNYSGSTVPFMYTYYDDVDNKDWYEGGTISYFHCDEINTSCSIGKSNFPVNHCAQPQADFAYQEDTPVLEKTFSYVFPASHTLHSAMLFGANKSNVLAGYSYNTVSGNFELLPNQPSPTLKHKYYIDRPIDLTIINPDERVIYNPSEVIVDPDAGDSQANNSPIEIVFPLGYTFKTILGRYPSYQQVQDAKNDPQNVWAYLSDERQVPVPVNAADLPPSPGTNPAVDYPEVMWDDPNTLISDNFYNDERYGYYYLQDKSTVKVEQCVKIYDARFEVNQGSALEFVDYSQLLGFENKTINGINNYGRIKIRGTGGAVLRNNAEVQYVQNGIITQTHPLHYIARQTLEAGDAVDPDTDQPQGNYDVQTGADVTFEAGDVIHLTNGFQVSGGNFSAFINTSIPDFPVCYNAQRIMPNQPKDIKQIPQAAMQEFTLSPNPSSAGIFNLRFRNLPVNGELSVFNALGIEVKRMDNIQQTSLTVSVEGLAKGIYMFRYREGSGYETKMAVYE